MSNNCENCLKLHPNKKGCGKYNKFPKKFDITKELCDDFKIKNANTILSPFKAIVYVIMFFILYGIMIPLSIGGRNFAAMLFTGLLGVAGGVFIVKKLFKIMERNENKKEN